MCVGVGEGEGEERNWAGGGEKERVREGGEGRTESGRGEQLRGQFIMAAPIG